MGHANRQADRIAQAFQVVFENVLAGRIAAAAVAGQQNRSRIAITLLADPIPVPPKTVTGELGGVAREADVDVPQVEFAVEDAVRNDNAIGPRWEVMVKCLKRFAAANAALAIELAEMLFGLGVDENQGFPADSYCSINTAILSN